MFNISKDEKRYSEIELDLHKKLAYEKGRASIIEELEKIKAEINTYGNIFVQWNDGMSKDEIVNSVTRQTKECVLMIIDKRISELKEK